MAGLFRRILVPHDGSEHATRALGFAARIAADGGGKLFLLRAIAPFLGMAELGAEETTPWIPPEDVVDAELRGLERVARSAVPPRLRAAVECRVVIGDAFRCIMDAARDADLIVMATHGRTGLDHLVIGSVAEKVVRHADVPVLTIRKGAAESRVASRATAARRGRARATRAPR
ncbi:MAG TPA: universal stress protein [Candidatus Binatia bacterium]|nr:universal stress protein [Candidatus Binatia bacterium]